MNKFEKQKINDEVQINLFKIKLNENIEIIDKLKVDNNSIKEENKSIINENVNLIKSYEEKLSVKDVIIKELRQIMIDDERGKELHNKLNEKEKVIEELKAQNNKFAYSISENENNLKEFNAKYNKIGRAHV